MMDALFLKLQSEGYHIEESEVFPESGEPFWHSTLLDRNRFPISGGFGADRNYSRKVAVAEFFERSSVRTLQDPQSSSEADRRNWGLDLIPTACGFAAGFNLRNTIIRSLNEAAERWVLSKWIDDQYRMNELSMSQVLPSLDPVSRFLLQKFDHVRFFERTIILPVGSEFHKIQVAQTVGFLGDGAFPGSSSQNTVGPIWQHALIESLRHLLFVQNNGSAYIDRFPDNRIRFFSTHAPVALEQIDRAEKTAWPSPTLIFHRHQAVSGGQFILARSIISGWKSWHEGAVSRFLY